MAGSAKGGAPPDARFRRQGCLVLRDGRGAPGHETDRERGILGPNSLSAVVRAAPALAAGYMTRRIHPPVSAVILENFLLEPAGIRFGMHPTEARITVTAKADALLKVCQVGTTFSSHWTGGCLRLGQRQLALPTSGGAVHVGFRVLPRDGGLTRVARLRVRWHCVDHYFSLLPGTTEIRRVRPLFDC
jgi:hypothetical protein